LAVILAFIGAKLVLEFAHMHEPSVPEISTGLSLAVIASILAVTALASVRKARRDPSFRAHAGALRERRRDADAAESR
jgi:tellurite resistance protein TerC